MKDLIIIPHTKEYADVNTLKVSYAYLHGNLENDATYDIFGFKTDDCNGYMVLKEGKYKCEFNGKECTLFLWKPEYSFQKGLAVYNTDKEAYSYAEKCFNQKTEIL